MYKNCLNSFVKLDSSVTGVSIENVDDLSLFPVCEAAIRDFL